MKKCIVCNQNPTLKASTPGICWTCAKQLGMCIYCGGPGRSDGICNKCDPANSTYLGGHLGGRDDRKVSDSQYHGAGYRG